MGPHASISMMARPGVHDGTNPPSLTLRSASIVPTKPAFDDDDDDDGTVFFFLFGWGGGWVGGWMGGGWMGGWVGGGGVWVGGRVRILCSYCIKYT